MQATPQNILEAFNQLPEVEKHVIASEIIKQVALLDIPPLTDEALTEIADALFVEHDKMEAEDAETKSREVWLVDLGMVAKVRPCLLK